MWPRSSFVWYRKYILFVPNLSTVVQYGTKKVSAAPRKGTRQPWQLEMVQRRAAMWDIGRCHNTSSVTYILYSLDLRTLEHRHVDSRYQIRNNLVVIEEDKYLHIDTGRRSHQYCQIRADRDFSLVSFFPRTAISQSDMLGRFDRNLQVQGREGRALQTQLIPKNFFYLFAFLSLFFRLSFLIQLLCLIRYSLFSLLTLNWW